MGKKQEFHLSKEEHIRRHGELHKALDELVADYINKTGKTPSDTSVMELMEWSNRQKLNPDTTGKV